MNVNGRFDRLLPEVQTRLLAQEETIPRRPDGEALRRFAARIAGVLVEVLPRDALNTTPVQAVAERFARMMTGVGLLQPYVDDPEVEEVMVRPGGHLFVEKGGRVEYLGRVADDAYFRTLAHYVADAAGMTVTPRRPVVLVDLPGGQRFTAMLPPLSPEGVAVNIRAYRVRSQTLEDLLRWGAFSRPDGTAWEEGVRMARFLERVVRERAATVLISGAFSTGKTTLLNALMAFLPPEAMVAVAESFREVRLPHAGCVRAVVPHFAGDDPDRLTLDEAVNAVLTRTRPDVIVLGEIVSEGEAREFLRAANLGVRGLATIHGNDARGALNRLADLATRRETPLEAVRRMTAAAVDLVVHMARQGSRRYAAEIARVRGVDGKGEFVLDILYRAGEGHEETLDRLLGEVRP